MIHPWARGERERGVVTATLFMTLFFGTWLPPAESACCGCSQVSDHWGPT